MDQAAIDNDKRIRIGQKNDAVIGLFGNTTTGGATNWLWFFGKIDWTKYYMQGVYLDLDTLADGHFVAGITENQNVQNLFSYKFTHSGGMITVLDITKYLYVKELKIPYSDTKKLDSLTTGLQTEAGWVEYTPATSLVGALTTAQLYMNPSANA
jgi:hypothetical protein